MTRPWLLRATPLAWRVPLYYRLYRSRAFRDPRLYEAAPLASAPGVRMRLQPGDEMHDSIAFTGLYEFPLTRLLQREVQRGGLLVDVGANYGYFSLLWAAASPANRVVAIEASPRNLPALRHNVESNAFTDRIRIEACAAGRENGTLTFDPGPQEQTGWGGAASAGANGTVQVPARRLDEILAGEESIAVLKIDVEGAEPWVLEGASALLREKRVQKIFFEVNKPRLAALGLKPDASQQLLRSAGYAITPLDDPSSDVAEFFATC